MCSSWSLLCCALPCPVEPSLKREPDHCQLLPPATPFSGSFLAVPAGQYKAGPSAKPVNTAYIYARGHWAAPVLHLPGQSKVGCVGCRHCGEGPA